MSSTAAGPAATVHSLIDFVASKDLDGLSALFADDAVFEDCSGERVQGRAGIRTMIAEMWAGMPDFRVDRVVHMGTDGNTVLAEFELAGTHQGEWLGYSPTGNELRWRCGVIYEIDNGGRIKREAYYYDTTGLDRALAGEGV
jgi:steroid delta-isomerase-like uncharacterized protein